MNSAVKVFLMGMAGVLSSIPVPGVTPTVKLAEYTVIQDRNPFGLVDPPPPVKVEIPEVKKEAEPPPNVELTGFFRNGRKGKTVALFLVETKKGEPKESYMWAVDEGDDGMKVLAINEAEETVRLSVRGTESTITFSKPKVAAAPAAPAAALRPGQRGAPGAPGPSVTAAGSTPSVRQFENTRGGRLGRSYTTSSAVGGALPTVNSSDVLQSIPPRNMRISGVNSQTGGQTRIETLTPREQQVLIEVNREVIKQTGRISPPLPPTPLTTQEDLQRIMTPPSPGLGGPYPQQ